MKMSDVWPSGFDGVDFSYGLYVSVETVSGEKFKSSEDYPLYGLVFSSEEPIKATMHAINNHDRMADEIDALKKANAWHVNHTKKLHEEIAELREALRQMEIMDAAKTTATRKIQLLTPSNY
jgi:hypothetical protein